MNKEIIVIILAPIICYLVWVYQNKRQAQKLSNRLHNAENNITRLKNEYKS